MKWICAVILLCSLPSVALAAPGCPSDASIASPPKAAVAQAFESATPGVWGESRTLIAGDSIAARWEPALGGSSFNFGHGGDRTQWILWRLEHADANSAHFRSAVVIAGTNNSGPRYTPCEIAGGVFAIVNQISTKFSIQNIVVVSLLPRGRNLSQNETNIEQTNQILADSAQQVGYTYVDAYSRFRQACDHRNACNLYLPGLIHPSPQGYTIFNELIAPLVR